LPVEQVDERVPPVETCQRLLKQDDDMVFAMKVSGLVVQDANQLSLGQSTEQSARKDYAVAEAHGNRTRYVSREKESESPSQAKPLADRLGQALESWVIADLGTPYDAVEPIPGSHYA
jgi:hypothetical protein